MTRMLVALVLTALGFYAVLVVAVYVLQDRLIYFPARDVAAPRRAGHMGIEEVWLTAEDGVRLHGWLATPSTTADAAAPAPTPLVLLFHGNAGNVADRGWKLEKIASAGFRAACFDYRGYGKSEGAPSEAGLYADGRAAAKWAHAAARGAPVIYYGESLGCAVAIETAVAASDVDPRSPVTGLVLEAPFTSLAAVGKHHYGYLPVGLLLRARYDNLGKIARFRGPLLVLHGEADRVIPPAMGRAIHEAAAAAPLRRLRTIPAADHNEALYFDAAPLLDGLREMAAAASANRP